MLQPEVSPAKALAFGRLLKSAREAAGISIEAVAEHLRIRRSFVIAIEAGLVEELPKGPYIDGHWKAYAEFLGIRLPSWDAARETAVKVAEAPGAVDADAAPMARPQYLWPGFVALAARRAILGGTLVVMLLGLLAFIALDRTVVPAPEPSAALLPVETPTPAPDLAVPTQEASVSPLTEEASASALTEEVSVSAPTSDVSVAAPAETTRQPAGPPRPTPAPAERADLTSPAPAPATIVFVVRSDVWVQLAIPASERRLVARILKAGERLAFPLNPDMILTIGAPQNLAVLLDGREVSLGRFTRRGSIRAVPVADMLVAER